MSETTPDWVLQILNGAAECFECVTPIEWLVGQDEDGEWEALIYPAMVEIDGKMVYPADVRIALGDILAMFEEPDVTCDREEMLVIGHFAGKEFTLRLAWEPPYDSEPARVYPLTDVDGSKPVEN